MKNWNILAGALAMTLLASGRAEAEDCATVTFGAPSNVAGWNPLNNGTGIATFTATATRNGGSIRSARIFISDNQNDAATKLATSGPQYEILDAGNNTVSGSAPAAAPTNNTITQFSWGGGGSNTSLHTFTLRILPSSGTDWSSGSLFSETLRYSIQCFMSNNNPTGTAGVDVTGPTVGLTIPSLLSITTSGPYNVNFQSFTNASASVNIGIKSTSTVNAQVSTANGAKLVTGAAPYGTSTSIPYTMKLNTVAIPTTGTTNIPRAGGAGVNWPLALTLTEGVPLSGKLAGNYSDTITLTLTPGT